MGGTTSVVPAAAQDPHLGLDPLEATAGRLIGSNIYIILYYCMNHNNTVY